MYIKALKLENFQKHSFFETDLIPQVNILWGETGQGKSCIIRALRWVLFNEPKGDVVRRFGSDKTVVAICLDNGVVIKRIKSNKENAYEIYLNGELKRYDAIGRIIPEEVTNILSMFSMVVDNKEINLNIAPQISLPFLLKESPAFRMKVFNQLTGNNILDTVIQSFNREIINSRTKIKIVKEKYDQSLSKLREVAERSTELAKQLEIINPKRHALKERYIKWLRLNAIIPLVREREGQIQAVEIQLKNCNIIHESKLEIIKKRKQLIEKLLRIEASLMELTNQIDETQCLLDECRELDVNKIENMRHKIVSVSQMLHKRKTLIVLNADIENTKAGIPDEEVKNVDGLKQRIFDYIKLRKVFNDSLDKTSKIKATIKVIKVCDEIIMQGQKEYKKILTEYKKCPMCHQQITKNTLEKIKL